MRFGLLVVAMVGCQQPPSGQEDPIPVVVSALASGSALAFVAEADAIRREDAVACWAWGSASFLAASAGKILASGGAEFPSVDVDLSACHDLKPMPGVDVSAQVEPIAHATLNSAQIVVAAYSAKWSCPLRSNVDAAMAYANGWVGPIVDEVTNPDGKLTVPAVAVAACPAR